MYLVFQYISSTDQELLETWGTFKPVVVASKDVLQYQTIKPTDVEVIRVPMGNLPLAGFIENPKFVIDSVAAVPIQAGEFVLDNKIISKNVYSGLNTQISVGRRAISIPVNVKSSIAYAIRPGNRVDLAAHFEYKAKKTNVSEVKVFLQDLLVLAVGRTIQKDPPQGVDQDILRNVEETFRERGLTDVKEIKEAVNHAKEDTIYQNISVEVTPEQAQIIVYVMTVFPDSIILLLRNSDDRQLARLPTINLYDVMGPDSYLVKGNKREPPKAVPRPKFFDYVGDRLVPVY